MSSVINAINKNIDKKIQIHKYKVQSLEKNIFSKISNRKEIKKIKTSIQALEESQRDIMNTYITDSTYVGAVIDENNYKTYPKQVEFTYQCYQSRTKYGSELLKGLIDTRISFIAGEGININATKSATKKYIEKFFKFNKLQGSRLLNIVQICEMEGKNLILLLPDMEKQIFKARSFSWYLNNYTVNTDKMDSDLINRIYYKQKKEIEEEKDISYKHSVYIKIGGSEYNKNDTPHRIHCVLTDIENFSRTKYDLRKNSHLFSKLTPYWKTDTIEQAKAINNSVQSKEWEIGEGYAGPADFSIVGPTLTALEQIRGEMLLYLKDISTTMSIPIHWLAWPELMSNRATAENLLEVVKAGTVKERLLIEEGIKELIEKSMILAIDMGWEDNSILGDFEVKLPLISEAFLKSLQETWMPLQQADVISMATLRNQVPGIDPLKEEKLIENEKQKNIDRFMNNENFNNGDNNAKNTGTDSESNPWSQTDDKQTSRKV